MTATFLKKSFEKMPHVCRGERRKRFKPKPTHTVCPDFFFFFFYAYQSIANILPEGFTIQGVTFMRANYGLWENLFLEKW